LNQHKQEVAVFDDEREARVEINRFELFWRNRHLYSICVIDWAFRCFLLKSDKIEYLIFLIDSCWVGLVSLSSQLSNFRPFVKTNERFRWWGKFQWSKMRWSPKGWLWSKLCNYIFHRTSRNWWLEGVSDRRFRMPHNDTRKGIEMRWWWCIRMDRRSGCEEKQKIYQLYDN
jgi:hypothetical protein